MRLNDAELMAKENYILMLCLHFYVKSFGAPKPTLNSVTTQKLYMLMWEGWHPPATTVIVTFIFL